MLDPVMSLDGRGRLKENALDLKLLPLGCEVLGGALPRVDFVRLKPSLTEWVGLFCPSISRSVPSMVYEAPPLIHGGESQFCGAKRAS